MTNNNDNEWIDNFSVKQLTVLKYALMKADHFIKNVEVTDNPNAERRAAFVAGFYIGYELNGGELPPEPLD